jgi:hypothetical protein
MKIEVGNSYILININIEPHTHKQNIIWINLLKRLVERK